MTAMTTRRDAVVRGRARRLRSAAARRVDQVPHRPRLGHRHAARRPADLGSLSSLAPMRRLQPAAVARADRAARYARAERRGVTDSFSFVHQPLTGDGSITVRVTSLTGLTRRAALPARRRRQPCSRGPRPGSSSRTAPGRVGLRGDHGHRRPRRADAVRLHPRRRRPARLRLRGGATLAAADPLRRHRHRLRVGRRRALDQGGHRPPGRAAGDRAGGPVRHLPAVVAPDQRSATGPAERPVSGHRRFDHVSLGDAWPAALDRRRSRRRPQRGDRRRRRVPADRRRAHRDRLRRHRPGPARRRRRHGLPISRTPWRACSPG